MRKTRPLLVALSSLTLGVLSPTGAGAADPPPPLSGASHEAEAQAAMERGIAAMTAGDAETALEEYRRAMDLAPDANLPYRYTGEALETLSRWPEAVEAYETYLKKNPYVRDAAQVQARVRRLRARYIDASLSVSCQPEGADVFLDDGHDPIGITPVTNLPVHAGEHHVVVRREGYEPVDARLRFVAGASLELPCVLKVARKGGAGAAPPPPPPGKEEPAGPSHARRTWGYIAIGAGATLLAGSAIVDATWLSSTIDDFRASAASGDGRALGLERRAHALQTTLVITYVTGAVAAATGVGLVVWDMTSSPNGDAKPDAKHATLSTDGSRVIFTTTF